MWAAFLEVWHETFGAEAKTAQAVVEDLQQRGGGKAAFREVLPDEFSLADENLSRKFGRAFAKREGIRYGERGYYLTRAGQHAKTVRWAVRVGEAERGSGTGVSLTGEAPE
jgi:hypothetical protein